MAIKPRSPAQERTARENLAKANKLAFTKKQSGEPPPVVADPPAKKPTYRAPARSRKPPASKTPASSRKNPPPTEPAEVKEPTEQTFDTAPSKSGGLLGALDDLIGSIFQ